MKVCRSLLHPSLHLSPSYLLCPLTPHSTGQAMMDEFKRELQQSREKEKGADSKADSNKSDSDGGAAEPPSKLHRKVGHDSDEEDDKKQQLAAPSKPVCKYGAQCTRKNPAHKKEYSHPK